MTRLIVLHPEWWHHGYYSTEWIYHRRSKQQEMLFQEDKESSFDMLQDKVISSYN